MDLNLHVKAFRDFADNHLTGDPDKDYHIELKRDHSLRVLDNAQKIIEGDRLTGSVATLATLSSLYHDLGRFPQYIQYGTFRDAESVNHGRLGVLALRDFAMPGEVSCVNQRRIRTAVGLHNVKTLSPRLSEPLRTVVEVVRDSDKLDIYKVLLEHIDHKQDPDRVVIHALKEDPLKYSDAVVDTIIRREVCDYNQLRYSNDFVLILIGWLYSLTSRTAVSLLKERGHLDHAFSLLPKDQKIKDLEKTANAYIDYKLDTLS